jgi:hypothetical protein
VGCRIYETPHTQQDLFVLHNYYRDCNCCFKIGKPQFSRFPRVKAPSHVPPAVVAARVTCTSMFLCRNRSLSAS